MCCGKNRAAAQAAAIAAGPAGSAAASSARSSVGAPPAAGTGTSEIMFELAGAGATSVRGPVSGRVYRFSTPGQRVRVDARDRPGLAAMPLLRWVR